MTLLESMLLSVVGFCVVLAVLGLLSLFIKAMAKALYKPEPVKSEPVAKTETALVKPANDPNKVALPADISVGQCDLHNVSDKDAALIMAIVADKLDAPLNTLVFKSIKEVK